MKRFTLVTVALLGFAFLNAQDVTYSDNFATDHDYLTETFDGTIWEGMNCNTSGNDNNVAVLTDFSASGGALRIESENGIIAGEDVCGAYIYRTVPGGIDFVADMMITGGSFVSFDSSAFHNSVGIFVRNPDYSVANHIYAHMFELWGFHHILKSSIDGVQTEVEVANGAIDVYSSLAAYPYIRLTRAANLFTVSISADGFTWIETNSVERPDMADIDLEVGIGQANYTTGVTAAVVDDFNLTHARPAGMSDLVAEADFSAYSVDGRITVMSKSSKLIQSSKLYSIDGREVASRDEIQSKRFDFENLKTGLYIAVVNIDGQKMARKVVVQ